MIFYRVGNPVTRSRLLPIPFDAPVLSTVRGSGKEKKAGDNPRPKNFSVLRVAFTFSPSHETPRR